MAREKSLTLPGRYNEIRRLCEFVGDGARQAGFDADAIFQIELACDEACTNIIEHTYGGEGEGKITVTWEIGKRAFVVAIEDNGRRFDPGEIPARPTPPELPASGNEFDIQVGGLGVYFMRELMDKVEFSYKSDTGNVVTMVKTLPGKGQ